MGDVEIVQSHDDVETGMHEIMGVMEKLIDNQKGIMEDIVRIAKRMDGINLEMDEYQKVLKDDKEEKIKKNEQYEECLTYHGTEIAKAKKVIDRIEGDNDMLCKSMDLINKVVDKLVDNSKLCSKTL